METVHATCVAIDGKGVLLCGPSGSGKSDLALRLIDGGAVLVADDLVALHADGEKVVASFPKGPVDLRGVIEVRGVGLLRVPFQDHVPVALSIDLAAASERLPDHTTRDFDGIPVDAISLDAFQISAPAKIRAALMAERVT